MKTEATGLNSSGAQAAPKALQDLFPVRRVLGMLQRNERLSDQPSPVVVPLKSRGEHQENQDVNNQIVATQDEEIMSESLPSQADKAIQEINLGKGETTSLLYCPKCGKGFSSNSSLRTHVSDVYPCVQSRPVILPRERRLESKTCFKCYKTFASWQGLRGHLNRVKPCNQDKPVDRTTHRRPVASRTCAKCGKTFSSPQSLRIHMNRVKPCDQDNISVPGPTTPPATTPATTPLMVNTEDLKREAERKAKARYQARKAYLKKRGRLDELGDPPSSHYQSGDDHRGTEEAVSKPDRKRNALDGPSYEGDNLKSTNTEAKKPRVEEESSQTDELADLPSDVLRLTTQSHIPTPSQPKPSTKTATNEGSFVHRTNKDHKVHGGDLLAGGCSCPPCVRRWARKLMNRMQQLEDEVVVFRQKQSAWGESASASEPALTEMPTAPMSCGKPTLSQAADLSYSLPVAMSNCAQSSGNIAVASISHAKPVDIFRSLTSSSYVVTRPDGGRPVCVDKNDPSILLRNDGPSLCSESGRNDLSRTDCQERQQSLIVPVFNSDKRSLLDAYNHVNDRILMNERAIEESSGHDQILVGTNSDFRRQIDERRVFICTENIKREVAVAALIAHEWKPRCDEFKALLENTAVQNSPRGEQAYHANLSHIAHQMLTKDKVILELERRVKSLGEFGGSSRSGYAEMGELTSKMAAEYASKRALESERGDVYVSLVKSSTRIRSLVSSALL